MNRRASRLQLLLTGSSYLALLLLVVLLPYATTCLQTPTKKNHATNPQNEVYDATSRLGPGCVKGVVVRGRSVTREAAGSRPRPHVPSPAGGMGWSGRACVCARAVPVRLARGRRGKGRAGWNGRDEDGRLETWV